MCAGSVPDVPLGLGVLKHRAPLARGRGVIFLPFFFTMDFFLCGAILNLKAFYFRAIPDKIIVDSLWECATFKAQVRILIT